MASDSPPQLRPQALKDRVRDECSYAIRGLRGHDAPCPAAGPPPRPSHALAAGLSSQPRRHGEPPSEPPLLCWRDPQAIPLPGRRKNIRTREAVKSLQLLAESSLRLSAGLNRRIEPAGSRPRPLPALR